MRLAALAVHAAAGRSQLARGRRGQRRGQGFQGAVAPRFIDIPAIPTDVRTPVQFKKAVGAEKIAADKLKRDTAPGTWTLSDTEGYASKARRVAKVPAPAAPTDADRAATDAFAKAARERATAPPSKPQ